MNPTLLLAGGLGILWMANVQGQTPTSYTGANAGVWNSAGNWTPSGVPTAASEVGVTNGTRVYIKTTTAALASNVTIGGSSGTSAIRIDSATTNSLTVGGNITLASGAGHGYLEIGENNGGKASLTLNGGTGSILNGGGGGNANIDIYNHVGTLGLSSANADNLQINVGGSASLTIGTNQTWNVGNAYIGKNSANAAYAMTVEGIFNASRLDVGAGAAAGTNSARLIFNSGTIGASLIQRTGTMDSEFIWNEGRIYKEGANVTVGGTANILTIRLAGTGEHVFEATAGKTNTVNTFAVLADKSGEAGTLTKRGAGTLLFLGTHTYTGATKIEAGTLNLGTNGSIASSTLLEVMGSARLDASSLSGGFVTRTNQTIQGSGTIVGNTTVQGLLRPGNSPGVITFNNNLSLAASSSTVLEFLGGSASVRGTSYDGVNVGGLLTMGGSLALDFASTLDQGVYSFNLFDFSSVDGTFANIVLSGAYAGALANNSGDWALNQQNESWQFRQSDGVLTVNIVPEASSGSLLILGLSLLALKGRRKRL